MIAIFKHFILKIKNATENDKIVLKNMIGAFAVKGLSLVVSLFTMPSYMRFFHNQTVLGVWFTVLSVLNWLLNFDFGIGNGLRNHLSRTLAKGDQTEAKKYISSAYVSVGILCTSLTILFFALFSRINWNAVFNIDSQVVAADALLCAVKIVFAGIMVQLFLKLISSVLYAMQKSFVNNFMVLCTSVITIILLQIIPPQSNEQNLLNMAVVHAVAVASPLLVATVIVFSKSRLNIRPAIKYVSKSHVKQVLSLGGTFLFVQLMYMIIMNTNDFMITWLTGNEHVVEYQIYNRLFTLGSTVFALAMTPVWSAVTKAAAEKDYRWIQSLYKRMLYVAGIGVLCEMLIIPCLPILVKLWLGANAIATNAWYGCAFAMLGMMMIFNSIYSSIANGLGRLKTQTIWFCVGAILKYPIAMLLVRVTGSWIGVPIANAVVLLVYSLAEHINLKHYLRQLNNGNEKMTLPD